MHTSLRSLAAIAIPLAIAAPSTDLRAQDVLTTAGNIYSMLGDSLNTRAMMATFEPGASAMMHEHPVHMVYVLEGGTMQITPKGKEPMTIEFKPGQFVISPPEAHSATNVGKTTIKALVIEVTDPLAGHKH